ncbi:hypothetical protein DFH09DRAFT_937542, partial [Mycena vulgaris]
EGLGEKPSGVNRLYRIMITESAYLIWKLRNESVIAKDGAAPSENEIHNRWVHAMNERLDVDRFLATEHPGDNPNFISPAIVLRTWSRVLYEELELPDNWLREPQVLVGITKKSSRAPAQASSRRRRRNG